MFDVLPYGDRAALVDCGTTHPARLADLLRQSASWEGHPSVQMIPGACTVLIESTGVLDRGRLEGAIRTALPYLDSDDPAEGEIVEVPVHYDGPDLAAVAAEVGTGIGDVIDAHTSALHIVDFCGFAPGFAYMSGLPEWLHVDRLEEPRTRVPAGSVAIAAGWSSVYPGESPGGWRLLGRTDLRVFDPARESPALLTPGSRVRFRPA